MATIVYRFHMDPQIHLSHAVKVHITAQDSSVKGGSQKKAHGTFLLHTKAKEDAFPSSDFELFCKGDFSSTNDLGEAKESYFLVFLLQLLQLLPTLLCAALVALSRQLIRDLVKNCRVSYRAQ